MSKPGAFKFECPNFSVTPNENGTTDISCPFFLIETDQGKFELHDLAVSFKNNPDSAKKVPNIPVPGAAVPDLMNLLMMRLMAEQAHRAQEAHEAGKSVDGIPPQPPFSFNGN